jgi:hypothetical protein
VASESPSKTLSFGLAYDALERRTFEFFRLKTTVCMSGYFQDPVWSQLVLQACHTEPVIRHAVTALGALHEERYLRGEASGNGVEVSLVKTEFPTRQYAKALGGLQRLLSSGKASVNVVLLAALLCVHFESLQERFIPALTHAENAMRLLDPSQAPSTEAVDPSLLRAFVRIDLQGAYFIGIRLPSLSFITSAIDNELPKSFDDLTQARNFVTTWSCRLFNFLRLTADKHKFVSPGFVALEALAEAQSYEQTFISIERLLFAFMQKPNVKLTFREHHGLAMLRALAIENRIIAAGCLYTEASFYDRFMPEMEQMLAICRFVLEAEDATNRLLSVSLDEGMLRPLYFVVTHCRDSRVRRSALALLQQLSNSHGVWHVEAMTKAAEIGIRIEESGCASDSPRCEDIPEWRRVHSSGFDAWIIAAPTRSKVAAKLRMRPNGMDGEWVDIDEWFEWYVSWLSYIPTHNTHVRRC